MIITLSRMETVSHAYLTLAAIAAKNKNIWIGTAVTPIPFRFILILVKMVATLDHISEGRFLFGVWIKNRIRE